MTSPIKIALYNNESGRIPGTLSCSWDNFIEFIVNYVEDSPCTMATCIGKECHWKMNSRHSNNPMAWSPVEISGTRNNANVLSVHLLVLDLDHFTGTLSIPYEHVWHTTHNNRENDRCVRVVLRLSRPVAAMSWRPFLAAAVRFLGVPADPTCKDLARIYFRPSHPLDAPHEAAHVAGSVLDVDAILAWALANPLPELPQQNYSRITQDEEDWDLNSDAVCLAISTIATYLPPTGRHPLALALAGMLRNHGATMEDARYIIREAYAEGGSENPEARSKTVEHTWSLDEEDAKTAFSSVCRILGDGAAREIGDCFLDASGPTTVHKMKKVAETRSNPSGTSYLTPAPSMTLEAVRKRLVRLRTKKFKSDKFDEKVRGVIIGAILDKEDLVPRVTHEDGSVGGVQIAGKTVDRDAAIRIAMGMVAFGLPAGTPFDFVSILVRESLSKMCLEGENTNDLERKAEREFIAAVGKKMKRQEKQHIEDDTNLQKWKEMMASV